jgi:hypothetical protein
MFSKASLKKIGLFKYQVIWPEDENKPFNPLVDKVEVYRYGVIKYLALVTIISQKDE